MGSFLLTFSRIERLPINDGLEVLVFNESGAHRALLQDGLNYFCKEQAHFGSAVVSLFNP
jgi:hypothetical protein